MIYQSIGPNQIIMHRSNGGPAIFSSYGNPICWVTSSHSCIVIAQEWEESKTTAKYLCRFLSDKMKRDIRFSDIKKAIASRHLNGYSIQTCAGGYMALCLRMEATK